MYAREVAPAARRLALDPELGLGELEHAAKRVLPAALYHYVCGASEDGAAHDRNMRAYAGRSFFPRVMTDVTARTATTTLFGVQHPVPFGIAPMGFSRLMAPDGDVALASAAARAGIPFILSGASLTPMEDVKRRGGGTSWFQAYIPGEAHRIEALLDRVEAAGFDTLVVTADTAVHPKHERAARYGFRSPVRVGPALAWQAISRPAWLWRVLLKDGLAGTRLHFENMDAKQGPPVFSRTLVRDIGRRDALSWSHLEAVRKRWKGRLVVKGVMAAEDAVTADAMGVDGIIVSNHGGRQLDCAAGALDALERIAQRDLSLTLMVDGGIRRGADVLKALKAGAQFVFVGRPMLLAAAVAGEAGVSEAIAILAREVDITMALLGITQARDIERIEMHA
ncbi:alpha-hydroxy-acid oxidizing protein [Ramlibacter sp. GTP1]|uniref:Alpha-hydroxy-acid oxidizing protein n=2 Tax=Ramlibacter albus TaxID=2079448 RepID=A0A923MC34_9BURK|nr:alpha-hydroxy acid oxidase [Ramlibacter albus]MBC5767245.1 alpha-hydroxy-acid oxidizing protein [Ramlibacter albus]